MQIMALTLTIAAAHVATAQPSPREIHQRVFEHLKAVRDVLVPAPAIQFVETFPPVAVPRAHLLQLAQVEQEPFEFAVPVATDPADPAGLANAAHDFAVSTTHRVLEGLLPRGSGPRRPVIVGSEVKEMAALEEDLTVMLRILEKAAGAKADGPATAAGIELLSFNRPTTPRAFYLDGYGAMFLVNVKYPLVAPLRKDEQSRTNETNTEWEKAREEVYGRRGALHERLHVSGEEFDSQRVENLKAQLINDLANAKNIRQLKTDDYVTIIVLGGGVQAMVVQQFSGSSRSPRGGGGGFGATAMAASGNDAVQSTMTLRVKKSDIDAFAKGKLDAEEFRKKVGVQVY